MIGLLRAEFKKLFSTRLWWALAIPVVAVSVISSLSIVAAPNGVLTMSELLRGASNSSLFVVAFATILFTSEFRHGLIVSTVLATPRRINVVVAKAFIGAIAGLLYGAIATVGTLGVGLIALKLNGEAIPPPSHHVLLIVGGGILGQALLGAFAACIGGVVRNQVAALVSLFVVLFVLSGLATGLSTIAHARSVPRFLPTNLLTSLSGGAPHFNLPPGAREFLLPYFTFWPAVGIFVLYVAISGLLALMSISRDFG